MTVYLVEAIVLSVTLAAAPSFEVQCDDRSPVVGGLVELSADTVAVETPEGRTTLAADKVIRISTANATATKRPPLLVELVDGSSVRVAGYTVVEGEATLESSGGVAIRIPTDMIRLVRFKEASGDLASRWDAVLKAEQNGDLLVVRKKEALDYLSGVFGNVSDAVVHFKVEGEELSVKRAKIEGLVYFHAQGERPGEPFCRVTDVTGSRYQARATQIVDGQLHLVTPAGLERDLPLDQVVSVDFKLQYLSDLEPERVAWAPFLGEAGAIDSLEKLYHPRSDRSLEGGPLRLGGKEYKKGLALHSRTEIVYRLPVSQFSRFKTLAGIDDRVRPDGDVQLMILGDDRSLFDGRITGRDPPQTVEIELTGVKRLKIVVDFGGDMDVSDYLDLCEPRMLK